ncbi:MAG: MBOAT family protein [Oscillospiraceae bacterium]|nr:MBOAT family protein [Oscillospiraceae bacterium]
MLFNSLPFVCFLAATLILYYLVPKKTQWILLLAASYVFYWIADWRYLIFIGVTTVSVWLLALKIESINKEQTDYIKQNKASMSKEDRQAYKGRMKAKRWKYLLICLIFNLGILSVTKYTNFVINNINSFLSEAKALRMVDIIVPMGISLYTIQSLSYVIDVYRGKQEAQHNLFKFALFVSFFPQLVQGPISRYGDLAPTLLGEHDFDRKTVSYGLMRVLWGYFKKVVIADRIITGVTTLITGGEYTGIYVFVAMLFYAFELYCDFTGGIDITIGIAEAMGIKVAENFNLPYLSKNIKEYWKRWHITMGTWFTDYIFYPISVCRPMLKLTKWSKNHLPRAVARRLPVYLSSFVVWLATGVWHGAAWNFIVWGLMNFVVIMISQELEPLYSRFHKRFNVKGKAPYEAFQIIRTILLMSMIRMFDCYRNVPLTFKMVGSMFTSFNVGRLFDGSLLSIGLSASDYAVLFVGFAVVLTVSLLKRKHGEVRDLFYNKPYFAFYNVMAVLLVVILVFGAYGTGYDATQFIYNQF